MVKLDPGLRFLTSQQRPALRMLARESLFNVNYEIDQPATVVVLVQFRGDVSALQATGLEVATVLGDVATGRINLERLDELEASEAVVRIEASRVLRAELDQALPEANITAVHEAVVGCRGSGVIVGIIDSGVDFAHPSFCSADGTTRILAVWDQALVPRGTEASPAGFGFGVEFTRDAIDAALAVAVRHQDHKTGSGVFHGTHVAGIAAGNGSVDGFEQPAGTFVGAAPEADIVCVATNRGRAEGELGLGDSSDALAAVRYIVGMAAAANRPVVINMSLGDNIGPHDGTSLLERALDAELIGADQVFLSSDVDHPGNRENRITLVLSATTGAALTPGDWSIVLTGQTVTSGRWDAWIQRSDPSIRCQFLPPFRDPASTISVPGTARNVITVGSYVSRGPDIGVVSYFSSRGPTRDGRSAPTLAAPGQVIIAPQPPSTGDMYGELQGTSMAAPLVAGVVALMLERNPNLATAQVREALITTARHDRLTGTTPNDWWGAGKLDAAAAVAAVPARVSHTPERAGPTAPPQ